MSALGYLQPVDDATASVWWLAEAMAAMDEEPCPPLSADVTADVCIVGGGYTGLWTAWELAGRDPSLDIVLIEATACGFGASGRNGGYLLDLRSRAEVLRGRWPDAEVDWVADRSAQAVDDIVDFVEDEGIECHLRRRGVVTLAMSPRQLARARRAAGAGRQGLTSLTAEEARRRTGVASALGGNHIASAASVQPAILARGLRAAALRRGVRIHEGTPMTALTRTSPATVRTPRGSVEAAQVVIATNAWASRMPEVRRSFAVIGTQVVATEPLGERIRGLATAAGELFEDLQDTLHYAQVSHDGRIVLGRALGRGVLSRVTKRHFVDPRTVHRVTADLHRWFPQLGDVRISHAWGGVVDRAAFHLPFSGTFETAPNVHYALGYSGNGVGPSRLFARILASKSLSADDEYTRAYLAQGPPALLPPEPFLTVGGSALKGTLARLEDVEARGRSCGPLIDWASHLAYVSTPTWLDRRAARIAPGKRA